MNTHDIYLKIYDESDLYEPYDPLRRTVSKSVWDYLVDRIQERKPGEHVSLHLISDNAPDEERVRALIDRTIAAESRKLTGEKRMNMIQQIVLFAIGLALIAVSLAIQSRIGAVFFTVLSTIGAFSIWEASSIWIVRNPKLTIRKKAVRILGENLTISFETAERPPQ